MTKRQTLELAAKAAGIRLHIWGTPGAENFADRDDPVAHRWDPLENDGAALRLAVRLDFGIEVMLALKLVRAGNGEQQAVEVKWGTKTVPDAYAATRLAIVRAAAELGKLK